MAKKLNSAGASHAASLIGAGKITDDKSWSAPSAEAENEYIKAHGMPEYSKWFMGKDDSKPADEKGHFGFPYSSNFADVSLRGLRAIISRAGQAGAKDIETRAQELLDEAKKKLGKDKERSDATPVAKICKRKAGERLMRNEVFTQKTTAAGYTANDLTRWLQNELDEMEFPVGEDGECCCCYSYPVNFVIPEHEKGETWQVIVAARGELYTLDFTLGEAGVMLSGTPKKVVSKDQYVIMDAIIEEADDEVAGRSDKDKQKRRMPPGRMQRIFEVDASDIDEANLELPVSFASELPGHQRCGGAYGDEPTEHERAAGLKTGQVYIEILDHDPANADHSVLNNHGAVIDEHNEADQFGVVKPGTARTDSNRVSRARLRMDKGDKGRMRFRQMKDMIRPHLSAGYKHTKYLGKETLPDGRVGHRFAWKGMEISSVAVPMDGTIGVGRSYKELPTVDSDYKDKSSENNSETKEKSMTEAEIKAAEEARIKAAEDKARSETETKVRTEMEGKITTASTAGAGEERKRCQEITKIADELVKSRKDLEANIRTMTNECLEKGTSVADFKFRAMQDIFSAKPAVPNTFTELGYKEEDRTHFSLKRGIQNIIKQADSGKQGVRFPDPDTFEGEVCAKMRKAYEESGTAIAGRGNGFMVPHDAYLMPDTLTRKQRQKMQRDATMQATIFGQGGASVATELLLPIIEILRNEMVTDKLGVTSMAGLEGNIIIPRQAAAATAYAVSETGALALSGQILDQIALAPHRVGAFAQYSKQFLLQSSMDVENFIRTDLFAVIALIWDEYILNGQGAGDQPTGILNTNGVLLVNGTGAFTGYAGDTNAPSWADIVNFDTEINKVNGRRMGRGWATTSNSRGRLETLAKLLVGATTVASIPLWEDDVEPMGKMKGYPAVDSQQVPNDLLMLGVWANNVIHALWGGLDIVVDPYSLSTQGLVKIVMNTWGDVALRHPQEFCISLNPASA